MATITKKKTVKSSLTKRRLQSFCKDKMAIVGFFGVILITVICFCAQWLTPYDQNGINLADRNLQSLFPKRFPDIFVELPNGCR